MLNRKRYESMTAAEAASLEKLRELITASTLPSRQLDENLLLATFNIREFGARRRQNFAINALAEICACFDIVAIQELRRNLGDLNRMLAVMGPYWKVVFTDPSGAEKKPGNDERLAYIYDSRVVRFTGLAAELLVTDDFLGTAGVPKTDMSVPWRTPYVVSFRAGTFDFTLLTVHIQWNESGGIAARTKEIEMITSWVADQRSTAQIYDPDIFVLGDFNIPSLGSATFKALEKFGLRVPAKLRTIKTNLKQDAHYDQIAFFEENTECEVGAAGVLNFEPAYFGSSLSAKERDAMTYQLSDHLPLWAEVRLRATSLDPFIRT